MRKTALVLVLSLAVAALADYSFAPFNLTVPAPNGVTQALAGAPADNYVGFTVTTNWSAISGNPWSNEARVGFYDVYPSPVITYANDIAPTNGQSNGNPIALNFAGGFSQIYPGGAAPFTFRARQTYSTSIAQWNDIIVTLKTLVTPTAIDLGSLNGPLQVSGSLAASEIKWYKFTLDEDILAPGTFLDIDTEGSTLAPSNDTELGLYRDNGQFVVTDDDDGTNFLTQLTFGSGSGNPPPGNGQPYNGRDGTLTAGTYYLALGGYNTTYGNFFGVTSASANTGAYYINFNTNIPEPVSFVLLALGLVLRRR